MVAETNLSGNLHPVAFSHSPQQQLGPNGFLRAVERHVQMLVKVLCYLRAVRGSEFVYTPVRCGCWDLTITIFIYISGSFALTNGFEQLSLFIHILHSYILMPYNPINRIFKTNMLGYGLSEGYFVTLRNVLEVSSPVIC